jgi:hypothetical protein
LHTAVRDALQILEDKAVNDVGDDDVACYSVVRVADAGVPVPVASPRTLIRTKDTARPSDAADRQFLQVLIDEAAR